MRTTQGEVNKGDRLIMFEIEFEQTKITNNFSSNSSIKEIKQSLKKQMLGNKNRDNFLIKMYINGKEIKDENCQVGTIVEGEKANLLLACLTLTDEIANDEKKIYENLIKNLFLECDQNVKLNIKKWEQIHFF